jgi:CRISPR-associated endonuclease/helicase Cas3
MTLIHLSGQDEWLSDENPYPAEFAGGTWPLSHQVRTAQAADAEIVINTHNTGTGKTRAALLRLLEAVRSDGHHKRNCLLIAPTNELLRQHVEDAKAFVNRNGLPHSVIPIDGPTTRALAFPELQRSGAKLHAMLENPRILTGEETRGPIILVVNPDIFYCALYFRYGVHDQRNLALDFLKMFGTVIIDEFHYYNAKQVANFLFFFTMSKHYGYFDDPQAQRQIVLLSATPNDMVRRHLDRLNLRILWVEPHATELGGSAHRTPALGPVTLEVLPASDYPSGIADLVKSRCQEIVEWVRAGKHGAVISDALWRINAAHGVLRGPLGARVGRLTGAENLESRAKARSSDVLLATPTVDIGYNFERQGKEWQSLDFLLFEADNADQLLQRLGRAARVLGKGITDRTSTVIAIVPDALYKELQPLDGQTMQRTAFADIVRGTLRSQHELEAYIAQCAINETMLPLLQLQKMGGSDTRDEIEALYNSIYHVYAPAGRRTYKQLVAQTNRLLKHRQIYNSNAQARERELCKTFMTNLMTEAGIKDIPKRIQQTSDADWTTIAEQLQQPVNAKAAAYRAWKAEDRCELAVEEAHFNFRDCFNPPQVMVYDPGHLLADSDVTRYSVIHVAQNYEARYAESRAAWLAEHNLSGEVPEAPFYAVLQQQREQRPRLVFKLAADEDRGAWEGKHCNAITALLGLELRLENGPPLPARVLDALRDTPVVCLLVWDGVDTSTGVQQNWAGRAERTCRREGIVPYSLRIEWPDGEACYVLVTGTAALQVEAEMRGALRKTVATLSNAVIL